MVNYLTFKFSGTRIELFRFLLQQIPHFVLPLEIMKCNTVQLSYNDQAITNL